MPRPTNREMVQELILQNVELSKSEQDFIANLDADDEEDLNGYAEQKLRNIYNRELPS